MYVAQMSTATDFRYLQQVSHVLRNFKEVEPFKANFSCPICGDSKRNKHKARGYVFVYQNKTFFKCQNCGDSKSFSAFLRYIDEAAWKSWRRESVHDEPMFAAPKVPQVVSVKKQSYTKMTNLLDMPQEHFVRQYVENRKIPSARYKLLFYASNFRELVEEIFPGKGEKYPDDSRLVIPLYNKSNELVGVSGRSVKPSPIRYSVAKCDDQKCFFGIERMDEKKPVFVTEGQIDSLFLPNSVAVCNAELGLFHKAFPHLKSYLIFDNEPDNIHIVRNMKKAIDDGARVCVWANSPFKGKDINEMVQNGFDIRQILQFIMNNSHMGQVARFKMIEWKRL